MSEPIKNGSNVSSVKAENCIQDENNRKNGDMKISNAALREEIDKRKKIEQELINERNFTNVIIESIPELFYVVDDRQRMLRWNKNVELVTGYSADELYHMSALDFFEEQDRPALLEWVKQVFKQGKSSLSKNYKYKDGTVVPYFFTGSVTRIDGKDYQVGVGIDCSEMVQAREALRESEERLALAAESAGAGLWALEYEPDILWMTPSCRKLHGLSSESKMQYDTMLGAIHHIDRKVFTAAVRDAVKTGQDLRTEYRVVLPRQQLRWVSVRGRLLSSSHGKPERLTGVCIDITERKLMDQHLKEQMKEVVRLKKQLEKDNVYLRQEVKQLFDHDEIIGESKAFKNILNKASQVAATKSTVLILGETGTGKEVLARMIHNLSSRRDRPLVTVNCASLPPSLIEGELFGREKGAYTGALTKMNGRFEMADGSTLFLDEIGELPYELQGKLLRAIELGQFERLGSTKTIYVDVRIIAATNRDLAKAVRENKFRRDLYYRLNVFPINIPPLRERREDIPLLVWAFVRQYENVLGKRIESIPASTMEALKQYMWYGNVREVKNVIEHAMIISNRTLNVLLPNAQIEETDGIHDNLKDMERKHICDVLERTGWRISGPNGAAEILGLKRTTLIYKMKALGIRRGEN